MHFYPPKYLLAGSYVYFEWNPELVKEVIGILLALFYYYLPSKFISIECINPDNMRIMVVSKNVDSLTTLVEPFYNIPYTSTPFDEIQKNVLLFYYLISNFNFSDLEKS